ncbi:MAG: hypothetical protein AAB758_02550, partial [Patescibacteria group bacterium]
MTKMIFMCSALVGAVALAAIALILYGRRWYALQMKTLIFAYEVKEVCIGRIDDYMPYLLDNDRTEF